VDYEYDDLYRLTREVRSGHNGGNPGVAYDKRYFYDAAGNRTRMISDGVQTDYTYDAANKMLTAGNSTFTYDDAGNTLTETNGSIVTTYTWDYLNRLTQWSKTGQTTQSYVYNADGMRVRKTPSGGTATNFMLDGREVIEEIVGSSITSYAGPKLISKISGTTRTIFHADGIGSTRVTSDGSQAAQVATIYDSYGNLLQDYPSSASPSFGYAGQARYLTDSTGLQYLKARYYDCTIGRFISRDPIGYQGGLNLYEYASSNPVHRVDPDGLRDWIWPFNSRVCNKSTDQCLIARGRGNKDRVLKPGECTSWFYDDGDFAWWNGDWFKCPGGNTCYIDDRPPDDYAGKPGYLPPLPPNDKRRPGTQPSPSVCKEYCDCQKQSKYNGSFKDSCDCEKKCTGK